MHLSILRFLAIWLFINYFSNYCNFQENIWNTHLSVYFIALYLHVSVDFISNIHINSKVCFSTLAALTPKLRVLFISIFWSVLLRDLLIYHSIACIIALHLLASVDFRMFSQNEFVSPLQQLLHTPKLRVLFLSIFWRVLLRGLYIIHLALLLHFIYLHLKISGLFFPKWVCISTSAAFTYSKTYSFIHICIFKAFTEGFVHISVTLIYTTFCS